MHSEINAAKPIKVLLVSNRKVVFTFDLTDPENEHMRDPEVVRRGMVAFTLSLPRLHGYTAEYFGDLLMLTVTGDINRKSVDLFPF